jgi:hypothetical protein
MLNDIVCENCQLTIFEYSTNLVTCPICGHINKPNNENVIYYNISSKVFKIGDVVQVVNSDHVWHNEFAVVCGVKPLFSRCEIRGNKIWLPNHWINLNEPREIND